MKTLRKLIIVMLALALFGCSEKKEAEEEIPAEQTKFNVAIIEENGYEVPKALKGSSRDDDVSSYLGLLNKLESEGKKFSDSSEIVKAANEVLYGKYDEMGSIELTDGDQLYSLLYIKTDGLYYPLDVYAQYQNKAKWMDGYQGDEFVFRRLRDTAEAVRKGSSDSSQAIARTVYAKAITGEVFDIDEEKYGLPIYHYDDFEIPLGLGLPVLTREETAAVNEENEAEVISTYADLLMYLKDRSSAYYNNMPPAPNELHAHILFKDYDVVKLLKVKSQYEGINCVIVLGNGDKFYVVDLFEKAMSAPNMKHFAIVNGMKEFGSLKEVEDTFSKEFPWGGAVLWAKLEDAAVPETIKAPNGMTLSVEKRFGIDVIDYCNVQIPLGLGLPELTDEEIAKLAAEDDPVKIRDSITTVADAICLLTKKNYRMPDNLPSNNPFGAIDLGNIRYNKDDRFVYTISGAESLMVDQGQCASLSTLLHFLLKGDYEELCYIYINAIDDGHVMIYIKNDGLYYLMNPVDYTKNRRPDGTYDDFFPHEWLPDFEDINVVCSASLEDMMVDLAKGDLVGNKITKVITIDYDGVFTRGNKNGQNPSVPGNYSVFPTGAKAVAWTSDSPIEYRDPLHPTSQLEIIGIADYINNR